MVKFIRDFMNYLHQQKIRTIAVKRYVIYQQLIKFYSDLQQTTGEYNTIPACTLATQVMRMHVKTNADVKRFYKKLELAGVV